MHASLLISRVSGQLLHNPYPVLLDLRASPPCVSRIDSAEIQRSSHLSLSNIKCQDYHTSLFLAPRTTEEYIIHGLTKTTITSVSLAYDND